MRGKNTIYINGRHYDAVTGLAVSIDAPKKSVQTTVASKSKSVDGMTARPIKTDIKRTPAPHKKARSTSRSATLRRDLVKKPAIKPAATSTTSRPRATVAKSPAISRFASHPMAMKPSVSLSKTELPTKSSSVNHTVSRVHKAVKQKAAAPAAKPVIKHTATPGALSSRELKEKLISEKLAQIDTKTEAKKTKRARSYPRLASIMTASLAVVVLGGYLTYINMPNISMRVAASQAGVNAKFPDYHPAGYSFDGPIAYSGGEVAVKFQANGSDQNYTIKQKNSNWDSQAVLDNFVAKESAQYMTSSEQGLTIYTYKNKAAWVNGGVLYTIEGSAPLSNEQVLRIAGSM